MNFHETKTDMVLILWISLVGGGYPGNCSGLLPYLGMVGRFHGDDLFWGFSLSHLVPEILGPKVGLIFHQNVLDFKHFVQLFSLIFQSN